MQMYDNSSTQQENGRSQKYHKSQILYYQILTKTKTCFKAKKNIKQNSIHMHLTPSTLEPNEKSGWMKTTRVITQPLYVLYV